MAVWFDAATGQTHKGEFAEECDRCGTSDAVFYTRTESGEFICDDCKHKDNS